MHQAGAKPAIKPLTVWVQEQPETSCNGATPDEARGARYIARDPSRSFRQAEGQRDIDYTAPHRAARASHRASASLPHPTYLPAVAPRGTGTGTDAGTRITA